MQMVQWHPWDSSPKAAIMLLDFQVCIWKTSTILLLTSCVGFTPPKYPRWEYEFARAPWKSQYPKIQLGRKSARSY